MKKPVYRVRIRRPSGPDVVAFGTGATWEEAAFAGYDKLVRPTGAPRRYLARVEYEPSPSRKVVRFGYRTRTE
ncbi:MAG TPA: hypothetical protein VKF62_11450, partial [Planctomycetota bacterium]|nr:hypothetical protein [Planctomycetota bacterium]